MFKGENEWAASGLCGFFRPMGRELGKMGVLRLSGLNRPRKLGTAWVLGLFSLSTFF